MSHRATLHFAGPPTGPQIAEIVELQTEANTRWYLDQWRRGADPPCCSKCAGVQYHPTGRNAHLEYLGVSELYRRKRGSCRDIAAADCAAKRAKAIKSGMSPEGARQMYVCVLRPHGDHDWHATVRTPEGEKDPASALANGTARSCPR